MTPKGATPVAVTTNMLVEWATDPKGPVALHLKQQLLSVEEEDPKKDDESEKEKQPQQLAGPRNPVIIYPPTYADIGYNIDTLSDNKRVALIDSVGSQANRMEPIFKQRFSENGNVDQSVWLVPQIEILLSPEKSKKPDKKDEKVPEQPSGERRSPSPEWSKGPDQEDEKAPERPSGETRSLLDLAHRSADAVVQSCPTLKSLFDVAFESLRSRGDAGPLCALAPTSLVFGVWDSRGGSGEKRPRLVRSIIRAWDVDVLHAAAQFNSVWKALDETQKDELIKEEAKKDMQELSDVGLHDAPATFRKTKIPEYQRNGLPNPEARVLGGVLVRGQIVREVTVNLLALRNIRGATTEETARIQKYLLGLALVAATQEIDLFLREGCHLRYAATEDDWYAVPRRGSNAKVNLGSKAAQAAILQFALKAAEDLLKSVDVKKNGWPPKSTEHDFSLAEAKKLLLKKDKGKKKSKKSGPTNDSESQIQA